MADDRPQFSRCHFESHERIERHGSFTFDDVQPLLRRVATTHSYLLVSLPHGNLDFTATDAGEMEMEIHDAHGMHIAAVTLEQAEEVSRRALNAWHSPLPRGKLSDLPIEWLCTSPEYV